MNINWLLIANSKPFIAPNNHKSLKPLKHKKPNGPKTTNPISPT